MKKSINNNKTYSEKNLLFHLCAVCLLNNPNIIFFPCKHKYLCKNCYKDQKDKNICSICRKVIEKIKEKDN